MLFTPGCFILISFFLDKAILSAGITPLREGGGLAAALSKASVIALPGRS